jgi:diacylglycerol kinase family enzyme
VNGRVFVNNSGIGFYPHFVRQREEQEQHGHVKRVAFLLALRSVIRRPPSYKGPYGPGASFGTRDAVLVRRQLPLSNRGLGIGTRSTLDSGELWVCTAPRTNRQNFARVALRTLVGRGTDQELNAFEVKEILVQPGTLGANVSTDTVKSASWMRRVITEFVPKHLGS